MAVLNKAWESATRVSPSDAVVTGEVADEGTAARTLADRPMLVYVTDGSSDGDFDKVEKVVLQDNKVCVGMWAFKCVKMNPDDVKNDPLLSEDFDEAPAFIFVSRDYEDVKVLDGNKLKTSTVYGTMAKFAKKAYKTSFEKNVKATLKVLIEFDKINNGLKRLAEKEQRAGADISDRDKDEIAKERTELEAAQKAAEAERDQLLGFELKEASA
jgi:hypothetical protein